MSVKGKHSKGFAGCTPLRSVFTVMLNKIMGFSAGALTHASLNLTHNFSKQAGKEKAAGRKKFLEFPIGTDQGKKQKLKVE